MLFRSWPPAGRRGPPRGNECRAHAAPDEVPHQALIKQALIKKDWSGPVSRVLFPVACDGRRGDDHFSRTPVARRLQQPTRKGVAKRAVSRRNRPGRNRANRTPSCLALLPMGFTEPGRSPGLLVSSYLTVSPLPTKHAPWAVCFLWHFPWPHGRWALPTIAPCGARTFLPPVPSERPEGRRSPGPAVVRSAPVLTAF